MLRRIGLWALCGLAVAFFWFLEIVSLGSEHALGANSIWVQISAPVALLGRHHPITWYESLVYNALIYGGIGLAVETMRLALRSGVARLRH